MREVKFDLERCFFSRVIFRFLRLRTKAPRLKGLTYFSWPNSFSEEDLGSEFTDSMIIVRGLQMQFLYFPVKFLARNVLKFVLTSC